MTNTSPSAFSAEQRSDILNREVARWVGKGWSTESVSGAQAVLFKKKRISFFWNLVLTLLTGGVWGIIWIVRAVSNKGNRQVLFVNESGTVERR